MRRITLLLAAILTVCSLNAQKGNKNEKVVNIDKVNYRITYNGKMVPDTTTVPYNYCYPNFSFIPTFSNKNANSLIDR
jgi:hypothetical protein